MENMSSNKDNSCCKAWLNTELITWFVFEYLKNIYLVDRVLYKYIITNILSIRNDQFSQTRLLICISSYLEVFFYTCYMGLMPGMELQTSPDHNVSPLFYGWIETMRPTICHGNYYLQIISNVFLSMEHDTSSLQVYTYSISVSVCVCVGGAQC